MSEQIVLIGYGLKVHTIYRNTAHQPTRNPSPNKIIISMMMDQAIKVQGQVDCPLFYEPGDIVIGKCRNNYPWPAVVQGFKGYDEDEVQVFTVDFFVERSYAHLETYLITPLTDSILAKMKNRFFKHKNIKLALQMAEQSICTLFRNAKDHPKQLQRLNKLYHPLKDVQTNLLQDVQTYAHKGTKRSRQSQHYNAELMPMLSKFYYDKDGNKIRSKEFTKRRLRFYSTIVDICVEILEAEPIGKMKRITTKICEGPNLSISTSKRMFIKNPLKNSDKDTMFEQQKLGLSDVTYPSVVGQHKKGELRVMRTAQLVS